MTNQLTDIDREAIAALRNQPMWIDLSYQERFERVFAAGIARERERAAAPAGDAALIARLRELARCAGTPDRLLNEAAAALASAQAERDCLIIDYQKAYASATKAEADAKRLLLLLRKLERWANDRIGESWRVHDAVNPGLFDQVTREFNDSGGTAAIDAALAQAKRGE